MNNPKTCPECGMPLVQCDNCEEYGARIAMRSGSSRAMNRCYVPNVPPTSGGVQQGDGKRNKGVRIVCLLQE